MSKLLLGKPVADKITEEVKLEVEGLKKKNIIPKLSIIRVGENPSDKAYERGALKRMEKAGIEAEVHLLAKDIEEDDFLSKLEELNNDKDTHGILIFRPLPKQLREEKVKYSILPGKDVDCFSPVNVAKIFEGDESGLPPATPSAVIETLKYYDVELKGKDVVVLGRSLVVGKPVSMMLLKENATVTICHSKTKELEKVASHADVVVAAIGRDRMVNSNFLKQDAIVIDVGINVDSEGNMHGDVDFEDVKDKVAMITPVPRGIGSVTTSILAKNVVKACKQINNL
ncbi:MAG: bifunctional 5,10-methylenetetrahydrofolate dehydrogenase/5,10-methenyltetrahydrofolate cyclohydrolase [Bacillota bacterium]|nr:bifunctional 5,10-methylenetetrahydrofolate dehydrogenase/5,10-methenyltetrahydrofolate cyclohydrolase [Bacillota bacterium]